MNTNWLSLSAVQPRLSQAQAIQLADNGSLTRRIRHACSGSFGLRVIDQKIILPDENERALLGLHAPDSVLSRRVFLCCDGIPKIFAKTIIGVTDKNASLIERITALGEQSLGSILFRDPLAQKRMMHIAPICSDHAFFVGIELTDLNIGGSIWVRRSLYDYEQSELIVYEAFLSL